MQGIGGGDVHGIRATVQQGGEVGKGARPRVPRQLLRGLRHRIRDADEFDAGIPRRSNA